MGEQLQCCRIIVPAIRPYDSVKHLSILLPTSCSVKSWYFCHCKRHLPGGTHHLRDGRCSQQWILHSRKSCCICATVSTSISTGDSPFFCQSVPLSRERTSVKILDTAHAPRGKPWGSAARRPPPPPSVVSSAPPPSRSVVRVTTEGPGFHCDPLSGPHAPCGFQRWSVLHRRRVLPAGLSWDEPHEGVPSGVASLLVVCPTYPVYHGYPYPDCQEPPCPCCVEVS